MNENLEKQKNDKKGTKNKKAKYYKDHSNEPVNKWLREYLIQINENGYGSKTESDKNFAEKSDIKINRVRQITCGRARVSIDDLMKISKAANVTTDEILFGKDIPNELKVDKVKILSKEAYNILYKHATKGKLFPGLDNFLVFLDYLIQQENFISVISDKCKDIVEEFKDIKDIKNIDKLAYSKSYDDFQNVIKDKELDKALSNIITNSKIRGTVKELAKEYIYDRIWGKKY